MRYRTPQLMIACGLALALPTAADAQDIDYDWLTIVDTGTHLASGLADADLDPVAGRVYLVGTNGPSFNTDLVAAAIDADGSVLWVEQYNGPGDWHDQGRSITVAPTGQVFASGNTPAASKHAQALVLEFDPSSGSILNDTIYHSRPGIAEGAYELVAGADGSVIFGGGTNGDGADSLLVGLNPDGTTNWVTTYDGPAHSPYSSDHVDQVHLEGDGSLIVRHYGVMSDLQPDYVLAKYDASNGDLIWLNNYGTRGGEYATEFVVDDDGDIYITGVGIDLTNKFFTVKVDGRTGGEIWRAYDSHGIRDSARHIVLDGRGGVYLAGTADLDGNRSNFNDVIYAVKRDAGSGAFLWDFDYGATCRGCSDAPSDLVIDTAGNLLMLGATNSPPYSRHTILFHLDKDSGFELERRVSQEVPAGTVHLDNADNFYVTSYLSDATTGQTGMGAWKMPAFGGTRCRADFDGDGALTIFDFLAFQTAFDAGDPAADFDGDGSLTIFDFLAFQTEFDAGCP
ncbi:MAG: hypothetical protein NCW75_03175 [Phycisphaera sp.]|nr:MAG: hypothetical protein NCW75_03175 [Phycisphaera sp.]